MDFYFVKKHFMQRCLALGLAKTTLKAYGEFFRALEKFLAKENRLSAFETLDTVVLRRFLIMLTSTMNSITIEGYYRRLKTLFNFLVKERYLSENPLVYIEKPKIAKRGIQTFSSDEVYKMLNAYDTDTFIGLRNYTLLSFLLSTGVRRSEFLELSLLEVDIKSDIIRIIGKGDKERLIPISRKLKLILKRYLIARSEYLAKDCKGATTTAFFISRYGGRLRLSGANSIFQTLRKRLSLQGKRFSAHIWRHTFAKSFLLNGGDIFTLQQILGHSEIETTKVYINLDTHEIRQQNDKFNPLDNQKWQYY